MFRNPKKEDYKNCAELIQISGPELFRYMYNESEENITSLLTYFVSMSNNTFSFDKIIVEVENDTVRGLILAHPVYDLNKFVMNEVKYISKFRGGFFKSILHILGMFSRIGLVSKFPKLYKDEYFITNLAVFKDYRGQGISKQLLNKAIEEAKDKGFKKVSLYVEIDNDVALKVYNNYGFIQVATSEFPKKYNQLGLYGFYKMVKEV